MFVGSPVLRRLITSAALALALAAVPLLASDRAVEISGPSDCVGGGELVATADGSGETVRAKIDGDGKTYVMDLSADKVWSVRVVTTKCWSRRFWLNASDVKASVRVFHEAEVTSEIRTGRGIPAAPIRGELLLADGTEVLECRFRFPSWSCRVPVGLTFDLRLSSAGYAPVFYWGLNLKDNITHKLEPQVLYAGASISGRVKDMSGRPVAGAAGTMTPYDESALWKRLERSVAASSNKSGFFQFSGLEGGRYAMTFKTDRAASATSVVMLQNGQALAWPQSVILTSLATLSLALEPAAGPDGEPWVVEIFAVSMNQQNMVPLRRIADAKGMVVADRLRPDSYEILVRSHAGSILERQRVDMSDGRSAELRIPVHVIAVRGAVRAGDDALHAEITFENGSRVVRVTSGDDGRFEAYIPYPGSWRSRLVYPVRSHSRLIGPVVNIEPDGGAVDLVLPGGRIQGTVVMQGQPARAAVHLASRDGSPVAQVVTGDDGSFDMVGLKAGDFAADAEGQEGMTPHPLQISLAQNESRHVELALEPYKVIRCLILTPTGNPASGVVVRFSADAGLGGWTSVVTGVDGRFEQHVSSTTVSATLFIISGSFPVAIRRVGADGVESTISLQMNGGRVTVSSGHPYATVFAAGGAAPLNALYAGAMPAANGDFLAADLEPGAYSICPSGRYDEQCKRVNMVPGASVAISFEGHP